MREIKENNVNAVLFAASNALSYKQEEDVYRISEILEKNGQKTEISKYIFVKSRETDSSSGAVESGTTVEKATELNAYFANPNVDNIYDVSGGDLSNGILPYLNYKLIEKSQATFWGYSDLTTVINAIYTMTGKSSVLYSLINLLGNNEEKQVQNFLSKDKLFDFNYKFYRGDKLEGVVVGGNIRCFLKLAGTKYFPDLESKVLFLESYSGRTARISTYFYQLKQLGAFEKISALILGTFTELFAEDGKSTLLEIIEEVVPIKIPVLLTDEIGHGKDSKALKIGEILKLSE